jgi:hypothetical protein
VTSDATTVHVEQEGAELMLRIGGWALITSIVEKSVIAAIPGRIKPMVETSSRAHAARQSPRVAEGGWYAVTLSRRPWQDYRVHKSGCAPS